MRYGTVVVARDVAEQIGTGQPLARCVCLSPDVPDALEVIGYVLRDDLAADGAVDHFPAFSAAALSVTSISVACRAVSSLPFDVPYISFIQRMKFFLSLSVV